MEMNPPIAHRHFAFHIGKSIPVSKLQLAAESLPKYQNICPLQRAIGSPHEQNRRISSFKMAARGKKMQGTVNAQNNLLQAGLECVKNNFSNNFFSGFLPRLRCRARK